MAATELGKITGEDTKASRLVADVNHALRRYDSVVVFTQYTDTMDYVRERLIAAGIHKIGCYSGRAGEVYNHASQSWATVTKADIKNAFRNRELTVLIGTDSMSEGLNLQTSGRLINYDMPWNLMRVEQRIGRVDRIGASYKDIEVTNYFYADTVEEQVYRGIAEDYGDFTDIVGDAAPVLANLERAIEQLALGEHITHDDINAQVEGLRDQVDRLNGRPVQAEDLGTAPEVIGHIEEPPDLHGDIDLAALERRLVSNPLSAGRLTRVGDQPRSYYLSPPTPVARYSINADAGVSDPSAYQQHDASPDILVTFDRETADQSTTDIVLLTYGTPELEALLPAKVKAK
ncbi:helicase-related protein [Actinopolymorpha sp. B9G3]|uniref:helicase-related protein n=1 Tax=Actinopolymorpha sp. B9G3 TaxID=3158970 RepID=UPI0032D9A99A